MVPSFPFCPVVLISHIPEEMENPPHSGPVLHIHGSPAFGDDSWGRHLSIIVGGEVTTQMLQSLCKAVPA